MIRKYVRLIIAGILFLGSILLFIQAIIGYGVLAVLVSGIFVLFHFKNEKNLIAFYFVRKNKFAKAEGILSKIKHPENMIKGQEAYFYYLSGLVDAQSNRASQGEKNFKKALEIGLRVTTDRAVARLNLSGICLSKRNKKLAKYHLQECKKLDKHKALTSQIREIEGMMKRI